MESTTPLNKTEEWKIEADVVVVGGGISGISCALALAAKKKRVVVIEARERFGGRIHTVNEGSSLADFGASWIHGINGNPLTELATKYKIPLSKPTDESYSYTYESDISLDLIDARFDVEGRAYPQELQDAVEEVYETMWEDIIEEYRPKMEQDVSVKDFLEEYGYYEEVLKLKSKFPNCPDSMFIEVADIFLNDYAGYNNSSIDLLSTKYDPYKGFPGGDKIVIGGYSAIFKSLLNELSQYPNASLFLKKKVEKISWKPSQVSLQVFDLSSSQMLSITAPKVVLTVPLAILKSKMIEFTPALPDWKTSAILKLGQGLLNKVILFLKKPICSRKHRWICVSSKEHHITIEFLNLQYYYEDDLQYPVLMGFVHANEAKLLEEWKDEEISALSIEMLSKAFHLKDDPHDLLQRGYYTRWGKDPYSQGSYSYFPVGVDVGKEMDTLAKNIEETIYFAGEATCKEHNGTVHAAYLSGKREAEQILSLNQ